LPSFQQNLFARHECFLSADPDEWSLAVGSFSPCELKAAKRRDPGADREVSSASSAQSGAARANIRVNVS
jgi:hypothetical protein